MYQTDTHNLKSKLNEFFSLVTQLKETLDKCEKCEDSLKKCERYVDRLEEIIVKLLRGEVQDLRIELSASKMISLRFEAECLPDYYYKIEKSADLICVLDTPLGKLLIYTIYDAVLNPSEETARRIVEKKVKPEQHEAALQVLRHWLNTEQRGEYVKQQRSFQGQQPA